MAKIPNGILGILIGTLGHVTGKEWKGLKTLSAKRKPAKTDTDPTPNQDNQRTKFGFVSQFHRGSSDLVKVTFQEIAGNRTEFQRAISHNASNAVSVCISSACSPADSSASTAADAAAATACASGAPASPDSPGARAKV